ARGLLPLPVALPAGPGLLDVARRTHPPARAPLGRRLAAELRRCVRARDPGPRRRPEAYSRERVIALLGNLSRDLKPGLPPLTGGGSYHGGRALQRLRVPARIVTRCAVEDRATLLPPLVRLGTPVRYVDGSSTATFGISYNGDVRTMLVEGLGDAWAPRDLAMLPSTRWVHVAPLSR